MDKILELFGPGSFFESELASDPAFLCIVSVWVIIVAYGIIYAIAIARDKYDD